MKLATAPVNWNSPDVPEYREYTPYPQLLEEMLAAGYTATEWSSIMPKDPEVLMRDLQARGMKLIGGFVGLELRDPAKRAQEISKGLEDCQLLQIAWGKLSYRCRQRRRTTNRGRRSRRVWR